MALFSLALSLLVAQDLTTYFQMMEEGQIDRIRDELPTLLEQYPDHPGILFLDAVTMEKAENAILAYKKLIQNHPNSPYTDDAMIKVGEHLFARGLYTQSSRQLAKIPKTFPRSEHVQRAIDLQINSLLAIGERDSVKTYIELYQDRFPGLDFDYNLDQDQPLVTRPLTAANPTPLSRGMKQPAVESVAAPLKPPVVSNKERDTISSLQTEPSPSIPKPFVVQVGAYGSVNNALRQKMHLEQLGYDVELVPISSRGKKLQTVQVVRYATRGEAETVGRRLKSDFGYSFLVIKRPE